MASAVPNSFKTKLLADMLAATDIRARLVMTNTTCDTEVDAIANLSDYTTIDPCDDTGYSDATLAGESTNEDDTNDLGYYDGTDLVFSGLNGDASRQAQGVLLYEYVDGTDANDIPIVYINFTDPIPATATQITVPWASGGIIQAT
jgi:hypothetical protein